MRVERSHDLDASFSLLALIDEYLFINIQNTVDLNWFHTPFSLEIINVLTGPGEIRSVLGRDIIRLLTQRLDPDRKLKRCLGHDFGC